MAPREGPLDYTVPPWGDTDRTYRMEARRFEKYGSYGVRWEWAITGLDYMYWYEEDAIADVIRRSKQHRRFEYRITTRSGPKHGFWRGGVRFDTSIHAQQNEEVVQVTKPLSVPRETVIASMEAEDKRLRDEHEAKQDELAEAYAGKLDKISKLADNQFLVLAMFEACVGRTTTFEDGDEAIAAAVKKFGRQPGTMVYETPESLRRLINVYTAATDPEIEVQPEDNVYQYLATNPVAPATSQ